MRRESVPPQVTLEYPPLAKERDGWYTTQAYERVKMVLRHKFFSLLDGHVATDEECQNLLAANEGSVKMTATRSQRLRAGKHNMAKGALRPEDAAVSSPVMFLGFSVLTRFSKGYAIEGCFGSQCKVTVLNATWLMQFTLDEGVV